MKKLFTIVTILCITVVSLSGCGTEEGGRVIDEGVITYRMHYPQDKNNNSSVIGLLPDNISMYFKDNNTSMVINGFLGSFNLRYVTNYNEGKNYSMLRVPFNTKLLYVSDTSKSWFGYYVDKIKMTPTSDTMTIAGYLCKKATGAYDDKDEKIDLWYTNNIKIKNPNVNNPFRDIDGVPLKFNILLCGIFMEIEAEKVEGQNKDNSLVKDEYFAIPTDYSVVSEDEMSKIMNKMMGR